MGMKVHVSDPFARVDKTLEDVERNLSLGNLKVEISKDFDVEANDQELLYLGQILLDDEKSLDWYGVQDNTTVYLLKKVSTGSNTEKTRKLSQSVDEVGTLLSKAKNPAFKPMLKKLFENKETVEKIINENEAIKNDLIVSALLRDPDLSLPILEALTPEKIVEKYPNMGIALKVVLSNLSMTDAIGRQAMLQNTTDDETDYDGMDPALLAQAELMAANEMSIQQNRQASTSQQQPQQQSSSLAPQTPPRPISASDLANALSFATMTPDRPSGSTVGTTAPPAPQADYAEALAQMRAVGAMDERRNRRALAMSGGNVEMALNLIYEGTFDE